MTLAFVLVVIPQKCTVRPRVEVAVNRKTRPVRAGRGVRDRFSALIFSGRGSFCPIPNKGGVFSKNCLVPSAPKIKYSAFSTLNVVKGKPELKNGRAPRANATLSTRTYLPGLGERHVIARLC